MLKYVFKHPFDEQYLYSQLFDFKDYKVRAFVNSQIRNNTSVSVIRYVIKYLLHVKQINPHLVNKYVIRYGTIITYYYLLTKLNKSSTFEFVIEFDSSILTGGGLEYLLDDLNFKSNSVFIDLFNGKEIKKNVDILFANCKNKWNISLNHKEEASLKSIFTNSYNFYSINTKLCYYKDSNKTNYDLIISEQLLEDSFDNFTFELMLEEENVESFKLNFKKSKKLADLVVVMAYIINDIFINDNLTFKKAINLKESVFYKFITLNKDFSLSNILLLNDNYISKNVSEFNFIYNNKKYKFTNSKIVSLD